MLKLLNSRLTLAKNSAFIKSTVLASVVLLSACGGSSSTLSNGNNELNLAAAEAIDHTIIPAATRFQQQANTLVSSSKNFCSISTPTTADLTAVQEQWLATNLAWFQLLPYRFGPMVNSLLLPTYTYIDGYRLRGTNYTASVRTKIDSLLADTKTIDASIFSSSTFQFVGLLALEVSLFEDAATQSTDKSIILAEYQANPRKCQLLTGYSSELLRRAEMIQQGWTTNYRGTHKSYRELIINNQLDSVLDDEAVESAIKEITVSVQEYYDYLGQRDITVDVGQLSSSIWSAIENSLINTEELLNGTSNTTISLNSIMANNRFEQTVSLLNDNISSLRTALEENNTVDTIAAAKIIDGNFKRDIPDALNINLGLNFSDGD
jgi:predicted lipoprotein